MFKKTITALLFLFLSAQHVWSEKTTKEQSTASVSGPELLVNAEALMKNKAYDVAEQQYRFFLIKHLSGDENPDSLKRILAKHAHYGLMEALYHQGKYGQALTLYETLSVEELEDSFHGEGDDQQIFKRVLKVTQEFIKANLLLMDGDVFRASSILTWAKTEFATLSTDLETRIQGKNKASFQQQMADARETMHLLGYAIVKKASDPELLMIREKLSNAEISPTANADKNKQVLLEIARTVAMARLGDLEGALRDLERIKDLEGMEPIYVIMLNIHEGAMLTVLEQPFLARQAFRNAMDTAEENGIDIKLSSILNYLDNWESRGSWPDYLNPGKQEYLFQILPMVTFKVSFSFHEKEEGKLTLRSQYSVRTEYDIRIN